VNVEATAYPSEELRSVYNVGRAPSIFAGSSEQATWKVVQNLCGYLRMIVQVYNSVTEIGDNDQVFAPTVSGPN
jgi:hypothetical protein